MIDFIKKWRYAIAFFAMILVLSYVVVGLQTQQNATDSLFVQYLEGKIEDDYDTCLSRSDLRTTLSELLDAVVEGTLSPETARSIIAVAGYSDLDEETQTYLANLDEALRTPSPGQSSLAEVRDEYKLRNPVPDCEKERDVALKELEANLDLN